MPTSLPKSTEDLRISIAQLNATYSGVDDANVKRAVRSVSESLGWASNEKGAFGRVIPEGAKVVIKPNFVLHANQGGGGLLPLITHPSMVAAVVEEALKSDLSQIIVGDAPVQGCDFKALLRSTGLETWSSQLSATEPRFKGIVDFRRTIAVFVTPLKMCVKRKTTYCLI
jgi:uncharacterized protein (DUF362 family)